MPHDDITHAPLAPDRLAAPVLTWSGKRIGAPPLPEPGTLRWRCTECGGDESYPSASAAAAGAPPTANRLYAGDNLAALAAMLPDFEGRVAMIYLDPPFFADADFRARVAVGVDPAKPGKPLAIVSRPAYCDRWPGGMAAYLQFLHDRLVVLHRLLDDNGVLFLHCDYRVAAYVRLLLDEVFAPRGQLINEICWYYKRWTAAARWFQRMHDTIFFYAKSPAYRFFPTYQPLAASTEAVHGQTVRVNVPEGADGKLVTRRTDVPSQGVLMHDVWEIPFVVAHSQEQIGYPTQKPVELLARMVDATTEPGDWVLDAFAGSGPLLAAAEGLRVRRDGPRTRYERTAPPRRWLAVDASDLAVHAMRRRLLGMPGGPRPFELVAPIGSEDASTGTEPRLDVSCRRAANGTVHVTLLAYRPDGEPADLPPPERERMTAAMAADPSGICLVDAWGVDSAPAEAGTPFRYAWHAVRAHRRDRRLTLQAEVEATAAHVAVLVADCFGRVTRVTVPVEHAQSASAAGPAPAGSARGC